MLSRSFMSQVNNPKAGRFYYFN